MIYSVLSLFLFSLCAVYGHWTKHTTEIVSFAFKYHLSRICALHTLTILFLSNCWVHATHRSICKTVRRIKRKEEQTTMNLIICSAPFMYLISLSGLSATQRINIHFFFNKRKMCKNKWKKGGSWHRIEIDKKRQTQNRIKSKECKQQYC